MPQINNIKKLLDAGLLDKETAKAYIDRNVPINKDEAEKLKQRLNGILKSMNKAAL